MTKIETRRVAALLATAGALLGLAPQSRAEDGITNTINATTVTNVSTYMVGTDGTFNALVITNAGKLLVTTNSIIGSSAASSNNNAWVTGAGSLWSNASDLQVGNTGSFNSLTISDGGQVQNLRGIVGGSNASSGNSVVVTGVGSVWSNKSTVYVGRSGSSNHLTITNGGRVINVFGYVGLNSNANNNIVQVAGSGSLWTTSNSMSVGFFGAGNRVVVSAGGTVVNNTGFIGYNASATNNRVEVVDPGSLWRNDNLFVGNGGSGNQLVISNGGTVINNSAYVGDDASASNNSVQVSGSGSLWSNRNNLYVGSNGSGSRLTVSDNGTVIASNLFLGATATSTGNFVVISDGNLFVTNTPTNATLEVRRGMLDFNGGSIVADRFVVTNNTAASTNAVFNFTAGTLTTRGATFNFQSNAFNIGNLSSGASIWNLSGTGTVRAAGGILVGAVAGSVGALNLIGPSAVLSNNGTIYVGSNGVSMGSGILEIAGGILTVTGLVSGFDGSGLIINNNGTFQFTTATPMIVANTPDSIVLSNGTISFLNAANVDVVGVESSLSNIARFGNITLAFNNSSNVAGLGDYTFVGGAGDGRTNGYAALLLSGGGSLWQSSNVTIAAGGRLVLTNLGGFVQLSGSTLLLTNGGQGFNYTTRDHFNPTANSNRMIVIGTNSSWTASGTFYVGNTGAFNQLLIADSGTVAASSLFVGASSTSTDNLVVISDGNLFVTNTAANATLEVRRGTLDFNGGTIVANRLIVTNNTAVSTNAFFNFTAGTLTTRGATLDLQTNAFSIGNLSGGVATWNLSGTGTVRAAGGLLVGASPGSLGALNLIGLGAALSNNGTIYVGSNGVSMGSGILQIAGGTVTATGLVSGFSGSGPIINNSGTFQFTTATPMIVTNTPDSIVLSNGTIGFLNVPNVDVIGFALSLTNISRFGNITLAFNNSSNVAGVGDYTLAGGAEDGRTNGFATLRLVGGSSLWQSSNLTIGAGGQLVLTNLGGFVQLSGRTLLLTNGGQGFNYTSRDHFNPTVSANSMIVTGTNSVWTASSAFYVGNTGAFNQLFIADGGRVANASGYVGYDHASSNNVALVTGSGSRWDNINQYIGYSGPGNQLIITNGGQVIINGPYTDVGYNGSSSNNLVLVSGLGSLWTNSGYLHIGLASCGNVLLITDGGRVVSYEGNIGGPSTSNNVVLVRDSGSLWKSSSLYVDAGGSGNQLIIADGGQVESGGSYIGYSFLSSNNLVLVTGSGSRWKSGSLDVGSQGIGNQVIVTSGGQLISGSGLIGVQDYSSNNSVLVNDSGSVWSNSGSLIVGVFGSGNQLVVSNGGRAVGTWDYVGWFSSSNLALITGTGSIWSNSDSLVVGDSGVGNQLIIADGGIIATPNVVVGVTATSTGNLVAVSGGNLYVTNTAANGTLEIHGGTLAFNGGTVSVNRFLATNFANSVVTFNGGTLNSGSSTVNNSSVFRVGDGTSAATLHLLGGAHSFANGLFINTNGWLTGTGAITGIITNAGSIAPGDSPGIITGSSGLTLLGSSLLQMELAGTNAWLYDQINLAGMLNFDGALTLSLLDGFNPLAGDRFDLFDFSSSSGFFSTTNLPSLPTGLVWDTSLLYSSGEIGAEQAPVLLAAASRKTHSGAGTFDLNLNLDPALSGTVEPRRYGPTELLFTFNKDMMAADGTLDTTEFVLTNATFVSASIVSSNLTLNLTNVVDQAKVTVVLNGIADLAGNPLEGTNAVVIRVLYGDANQSGSVSVGDMQATKNKLSQVLTSTNYLCDLNLSGTISVGDMQVAKNMLSHSVPLGDFNPTTPPLQFSITPTFAVPATTIGEALGAPELAWDTNGDELWSPTIAPDGSTAAWSGSIGDLQVSWVETTVTGPGVLAFDWKVSSEPGEDFLTFSLDGVDQPGRISGEVDWQPLTFSITSGTHRLRWTYAKNRANAAGYDAGWLRRVTYTPTP
ncbi:MAG: hypothetical protein HZA91_21020 [Verrucomicrobia bacterium]|nr:hypothetical protein [Verrucomicrobiota bacterium]